ncbi:MAG: DUF4832 domain-containing protein [Planctomycetia bacterium]|nr:DUF4832 domain-containing protein [Planctomycetia bacterium]
MLKKKVFFHSIIIKTILIFGSFYSTFLFAQETEEPELNIVAFQDDGRALINPMMGWTMHFYSNIPTNYGSKLEPSDSLEWFEGCSTVYLRLPWAYLEPEEGVFNWAILDTPAQRWIEKGKKVAFRFTTSESWLDYATPQWVEKAGAKMIRYNFGKGPDPDGKLHDPIYDDPVFLEKLSHFLEAAGKRYNGNPNVAFIDVGSFGTWGEGHTLMASQLADEENIRMARIHIDLHLKYFPDTQLCISDDVIGPSALGDDFPLMNECVEKGVSLRDDSILVQPFPNHWYHAELAQKFWPTLPVILEHEHLESSKIRKAWDEKLLLQSIEDYHASYMSIHWFPQEEWEQCQNVIRQINKRLGYRIQIQKIQFPKTITIGQFFNIETILANAGVAPCYPGGFLTLTLKDEKGGIVSILTDESFDMKSLEVGPPDNIPTQTFRSRFRIGYVAPTTKPGVYDLFLSIGKRDGTPTIELPLPNADQNRRYKIGTVILDVSK